jgi:hypothetical protein
VDEKEYINRVEKNRKAGPFVVGDGALQGIFFFSFATVFRVKPRAPIRPARLQSIPVGLVSPLSVFKIAPTWEEFVS